MRRALRHFGGRPRLSKLAQVLAKFGFHAPLLGSVIPAKGVGAASFTRTGTAITTVVDHEGAIRLCKVGEARFQRLRRVENRLRYTEDLSNAVWSKVATGTGVAPTVTAGFAAPDGTNTAWRVQLNRGAGTTSGDESNLQQSVTAAVATPSTLGVWLRSNTGSNYVLRLRHNVTPANITITPEWTWFAAVRAANTNCTFELMTRGDVGTSASADVLFWHPQLELTQGAVNANPSEYVSQDAPKANRLIETENFGAAAWLKSVATVAESAVRGPNGERAWETTWNAGGFFYQLADGGTGGAANEVCYARVHARAVSTATKVGCRIDRNGVPQGNQQDYAITNSAWTEVLIGPFTLDANTASPALRFDHFDGNVILTRAQLVRGSALPAYSPVGNVYPYHGACVDGVRYFDYANGNTVVNNVVVEGNGTGLDTSQAGYLPEPAVANLVLQSSNFGTTWAVSGAATIATAAAARCGDIALDLLSDADAGQAGAFSQTPTFTGDAVKSVSLLVKQGTSTSTAVRLRDNTAGQNRLLAAITWSNGIPVVTMTTGSQERSPEALGNGIYRLFLASSSVTAANTHTLSLYPASDAALSVANTGTIYVGGVQASDTSTATTLVPTTTAAVTRNADTLTYPAAGNVNEAGGSLFVKWYQHAVPAGISQVLVQVDDGSNVDIAPNIFVNSSNGALRAQTLATSVVQGDVQTAGTISAQAEHRGAARFAPNDFICHLDGTASAPDTTGSLPTGLTLINVGCRVSGPTPLLATVRNVRVCPRTLTNAEHTAITRAA